MTDLTKLLQKYRNKWHDPESKVSISQEELSDRLGYARATYGQWERGRGKPDRAGLVRLIGIFVEGKGIESLEEANTLLQAADYAELRKYEIVRFNLVKSSSFIKQNSVIFSITGMLLALIVIVVIWNVMDNRQTVRVAGTAVSRELEPAETPPIASVTETISTVIAQATPTSAVISTISPTPSATANLGDSQPTPPPSAVFLRVSAGMALTNQDYDQAIHLYTQVIELAPISSDYVRRGLAFMNTEELENAITDFTEALNLDPNDDEAYAMRGAAQINNQRYDLAIADFTKAIEIKPSDAQLCVNRAVAYLGDGQALPAISDYQKAYSLTDEQSLKNQIEQALTDLGIEVEE